MHQVVSWTDQTGRIADAGVGAIGHDAGNWLDTVCEWPAVAANPSRDCIMEFSGPQSLRGLSHHSATVSDLLSTIFASGLLNVSNGYSSRLSRIVTYLVQARELHMHRRCRQSTALSAEYFTFITCCRIDFLIDLGESSV